MKYSGLPNRQTMLSHPATAGACGMAPNK